MFTNKINYTKLKTNLRLAVNRLKLLQKKKTELAQKARKEIADYIAAGKYERAKIRVEHVIREDYMVEGLELIEVYCDLLLSRFGMLQQNSALDTSLMEAVSSILWAACRLDADVTELKVISEQLTLKYGKNYSMDCHAGTVETVSEKLKHKLDTCPPPKILIEKYLIEISKNYNVPYEPDSQVLNEYEQSRGIDHMLFDVTFGSGRDEHITRPTGFVGFPHPLLQTSVPMPMPMPTPTTDLSSNRLVTEQQQSDTKCTSYLPGTVDIKDIPADVALSTATRDSDEIDFEDLTKRFDELKKKK